MRAQWLLFAVFVLTACDKQNKPNTKENTSLMAKIEGSAFYRERIMLPPGASLVLTLEDITQRKIKPAVIAKKTLLLNNTPPYTFSLNYPKDKIQKGHQYVIKGEITYNKQRMLVSDLRINLLDSAETPIVLHLKKIPVKDTAKTLNAQVKNKLWQLIELNDQTVYKNQKAQTIPTIQFCQGNKIVGFTGCSQMTGKYLLNKRQIALRPSILIVEACSDVPVSEAAFLAALKNTASLKVSDNHLMLLSSGKKVIAVFAARAR